MNKPDLVALLEQLQAELRLRDWRIEISYVRDLTTDDGRIIHGLCQPLADAKVATIQIRDPETPVGPRDPSVEEILVHELVHLHFAPLAGFTQADVVAEEQAVWALAEALVTAKEAGRRAQVARAMVALVDGAKGRRAPRTARVVKERTMTPEMLAALKSIVTAEDPKAALEAYIKEIEAQTGAAAPVAAAAAAPLEEPCAAEAAPDEKTMRARALVARPGDTVTVGDQSGTVTAAAADKPVSQRDFNEFKVEQILAREGAHLTKEQRAFASCLTPTGVRRYLAATPAPKVDDAGPAAGTAERRRSPTQGDPTRRSQRALDPKLEAHIDRAMGVAPATPTQAVRRDPHSGRLQISNIATAPVQVAQITDGE